MNIEAYKELTNAQLKEECEDLGIEKVIGSNNPSKPSKEDYITAIKRNLSYEPIEIEEAEVEDEVETQRSREPESIVSRTHICSGRCDINPIINLCSQQYIPC